MTKGDIVLIPFPFTDLTGNKLRPALVLIETGNEVVVSFFTSQLHWQEKNDIIFQPEKENGLKTTSLLRLSKIATLEKKLIIGKLGNLSKKELGQVDQNLLKLFKIVD